tara:strand:- start:454 stop:666 length:213 start_codon:yes stop_codon:yes gene_type:complete
MKDKIDEVCANLELGCIDWEEASKQLFDLFVVSHQRELLISFAEYLKDRKLINVRKENLTIRVDLYLKRD